MNTLREIQAAADALPRSEQERLLRHLDVKLRPAPKSPEKPASAGDEPVMWPDYEARLRAIYGDRKMPSMVLTEREMAAW